MQVPLSYDYAHLIPQDKHYTLRDAVAQLEKLNIKVGRGVGRGARAMQGEVEGRAEGILLPPFPWFTYPQCPRLSPLPPPPTPPNVCRWGWSWTSPTAPGFTALRRSCLTRRKGRYFTARCASPGAGGVQGGLLPEDAQGRAGGAWSGVCRRYYAARCEGPGGGGECRGVFCH